MKKRKNEKRLDKNTKNLLSIFARYFILILVSIPNLWIFYAIFTPLTVYFSYFLLNIFFQASLTGNTIIIQNYFSIELIEACIAGSAYYLLLILNLTIPKVKLDKRIKLLLFSFLTFFVINNLRIFIMSVIFVNGSSWFDTLHALFWYLGSIVFVVGVWFLGTRIFHVKEIPIYSDLKTFFRLRKKAR